MARILIARGKVPLGKGPGTLAPSTLLSELRRHGYEADVVEIPARPEQIEDAVALWRSFDLESIGGITVDAVIALDLPASRIRHPNRTVWLASDATFPVKIDDLSIFVTPDVRRDGLKGAHVLPVPPPGDPAWKGTIDRLIAAASGAA